MRSDFDSGSPPRYMSLSRSRISLPSGDKKGMLRLLTEMDPREDKKIPRTKRTTVKFKQREKIGILIGKYQI